MIYYCKGKYYYIYYRVYKLVYRSVYNNILLHVITTIHIIIIYYYIPADISFSSSSVPYKCNRVAHIRSYIVTIYIYTLKCIYTQLYCKDMYIYISYNICVSYDISKWSIRE